MFILTHILIIIIPTKASIKFLTKGGKPTSPLTIKNRSKNKDQNYNSNQCYQNREKCNDVSYYCPNRPDNVKHNNYVTNCGSVIHIHIQIVILELNGKKCHHHIMEYRNIYLYKN